MVIYRLRNIQTRYEINVRDVVPCLYHPYFSCSRIYRLKRIRKTVLLETVIYSFRIHGGTYRKFHSTFRYTLSVS